jgi:hypothetical protein
MRALARAACGAAAALALAAGRGGAQDLSQRFSITSAGDTTFTFAIGKTGWVKPKQRGMAVDAQRRDALVARFRVIGVRNGVATALITGQTTPVTSAYTVVMQRPPERWYSNARFWAGAVVGVVAGVLAGVSVN